MLCFIVCLLGQQVAKKPRIEECLPRMNVTVLGDRGTWNILELELLACALAVPYEAPHQVEKYRSFQTWCPRV